MTRFITVATIALVGSANAFTSKFSLWWKGLYAEKYSLYTSFQIVIYINM